ncbi:hypothetical protein PGTUg99_009765 [Puccinia graminis f. sp. tritici]|uniref:Uncharacterized protein n=1 Tax=Puccinia graminis f. sp. tritici TaxID=56615 RepID=A0A5B0RU91_PUCGR|nr:hypothetical protein PGTUg99_009765 [Puccinia graminis f. sp. tritici]
MTGNEIVNGATETTMVFLSLSIPRNQQFNNHHVEKTYHVPFEDLSSICLVEDPAADRLASDRRRPRSPSPPPPCNRSRGSLRPTDLLQTGPSPAAPPPPATPSPPSKGYIVPDQDPSTKI